MAYTAIIDDNDEFEISFEDLSQLDLEKLEVGSYHVIKGARGFRIKVLKTDYPNKTITLSVDGKEVSVHLRDGVETMVHDMGLDVIDNSFAQELHAPMPGLVLSVNVDPGEEVSKGAKVVILEAMKMENVLSAPSDVTIAEIHVEPGQAVDKGQLLVTFASEL